MLKFSIRTDQVSIYKSVKSESLYNTFFEHLKFFLNVQQF